MIVKIDRFASKNVHPKLFLAEWHKMTGWRFFFEKCTEWQLLIILISIKSSLQNLFLDIFFSNFLSVPPLAPMNRLVPSIFAKHSITGSEDDISSKSRGWLVPLLQLFNRDWFMACIVLNPPCGLIMSSLRQFEDVCSGSVVVIEVVYSFGKALC